MTTRARMENFMRAQEEQIHSLECTKREIATRTLAEEAQRTADREGLTLQPEETGHMNNMIWNLQLRMD